jgi:tetratricopeptide (TPR) repeat protein
MDRRLRQSNRFNCGWKNMYDCFDEIHKLLREHQDETILKKILNEDGKVIHQPYSTNLNHSWYVVGDIFFSAKKYRKAIEAFQNSIQASPEDIDAHLALANSYSELGEAEFAKGVLIDALNIEPNEPRLHYNLGNAFFDIGDLANAKVQYELVVGLRHNSLERLAISNLKKIKTAYKKLK